KAVSLLERADLVLSVQVLQEFYVQAVRPTRAERLTHQQAAAQAAGCTEVWSEDLAHGRQYEGLRVINPFL
ncbi:MAG TPA: hypothetical protein VGD78_04125, partial [Chthoniobacterales bacterium]